MKASHLQYHSLEAWTEGLPENWATSPDMAKRDLWHAQYAELKQHLWNQHLATLSSDEQREFREGTHPSQSHQFHERAQPFVQLLAEELVQLGYSAEVKVGFYHMDRIVLSAALDRMPPSRSRNLPWLFRGFEVKYGFPPTTKPSLTAQQSPTSRNRALAMVHFVFGGLWIPLGAFVAYIFTFVIVVSTNQGGSMGDPATLWDAKPAWARLFVGTFAVFPALALMVSGVCLLKSRARPFILVVAWLSCLIFPIGTALGVWTLLSLRRRDGTL